MTVSTVTGVPRVTMPLHKRILDMLPALIVFASVAAFGTYVAVAYVLHDAWWLNTVATQHARNAHHAAAPHAPRH